MKVGPFWLDKAAEVARQQATCQRDRCGAVIVLDQHCVGAGYNAPPLGQPHRCSMAKPSVLKPKSDRTCCVHAEWRAILEARSVGKLDGSTLFFTRVSPQGARLSSGLPYCTVCSRLALVAGVRSWVLDHGPPRGLIEYPAKVYDDLSHDFDLLTAWQAGQRAAKTLAELPSPLWLQEDMPEDRHCVPEAP